MIPTPVPKPSKALMIGIPAAINDPNVIRSTTNATITPINSEEPPISVDSIPVPISSTCTLCSSSNFSTWSFTLSFESSFNDVADTS